MGDTYYTVFVAVMVGNLCTVWWVYGMWGLFSEHTDNQALLMRIMYSLSALIPFLFVIGGIYSLSH